MKTLSDDMINIKQEKFTNIDSLLEENKKIVAFLGTSKNGTSFMINNVAKILSSKGTDVAILDATKNKSSYFIYTKNQNNLRRIASTSIENLTRGISDGIKVSEHLTVYTGLPNEDKFLEQAEPVLETLIKNHTLILIDCDFNTPIDYFKYVQELYLVQSMDVLSIQPLTETLAKIEDRALLDEKKIRIILNKFLSVDGISEKEIIGGMAFYNEPALSYMKQLFNKNTVKYMVIPFDENVYTKYVEGLAKCEINLDGYSSFFYKLLEQLSYNVYSM